MKQVHKEGGYEFHLGNKNVLAKHIELSFTEKIDNNGYAKTKSGIIYMANREMNRKYASKLYYAEVVAFGDEPETDIELKVGDIIYCLSSNVILAIDSAESEDGKDYVVIPTNAILGKLVKVENEKNNVE